MELSETEQRMLDNLEKRQARWKFGRWLVLLISLLLLLGIFPSVSDDSIYKMIGAAAIGMTLSMWNGNPESILLVRVVKHNLGHDESER
ncbi:MAG TPA: hypothetical protein DD407_11490 [Pseudohongiella sp.]|nr:hypothetical protein [Gammaproteobacteria bacterium]HBN15651.1 hypothetical protein [Pseudohongiella sp.]|tara:strand:+ start:631 stop:897 length:267 start_codon:yes stop_codon:yes gene_type:complete